MVARSRRDPALTGMRDLEPFFDALQQACPEASSAEYARRVADAISGSAADGESLTKLPVERISIRLRDAQAPYYARLSVPAGS